MKVHQIFTESPLRNFTYLVEGDQGHFFVLDPWDGESVLNEVQARGGLLKGVINTHEHSDHTCGNAIIAKKTSCPFYVHANGIKKIPCANNSVGEGDTIKIDEKSYFEVLDTPGHTCAHLCLLLWNEGAPVGLFSGDTLFNAGVGNCHNGGDPEVLFETIDKKLGALSEDIIVYPGHEYLGNNLGFTLEHEPSNEVAKSMLEDYKKVDWTANPVTTTLKTEKEINTFFRLDNEKIKKNLCLEEAEKKEVFLKLRQLRNKW
jgi:hydroxyacylglutathione hydrolase